MDLTTRRRVMLAAQPRLPWGYQEVEYLESTQTQYIDTGVPTSNSIKITAKAINTFGIKNNGSYGAMLFGGRVTNSESNISYASGRSNDYIGNGGGFLTIQKNDNRGLLTIEYDNHLVQISCGNYAFSNSLNVQITNPKSIFLFSTNQNGNPEQSGTWRILDFTIAENDMTVRKFIPCYRKSDSKPGMYDLVSKTFFTNAGTGEFIIGPDVN